MTHPLTPTLSITNATFTVGERTLWQDVNLAAYPGEFIAVLGANGSGKSSLLRAIVGEVPLAGGQIAIGGKAARRGSHNIGYIPQRLAIDDAAPITARNLVRLGIDGHRWGIGLLGARAAQRRAKDLLAAVGVADRAHAPITELSGGELQRVRLAQALGGNPGLVLCDEPLAALDLASAGRVVALIDQYRRETGATVLFITHDINAVLEVADRVLYLAGGQFTLGTPEEVFTSATLSRLYGVPVDVLHAGGRIVVSAATDPGADAELAHFDDGSDCLDPHGHQHLIDPAQVAVPQRQEAS